MLEVNYFIKCFGDAAAYRLYVYMLLSVAGRPFCQGTQRAP